MHQCYKFDHRQHNHIYIVVLLMESQTDICRQLHNDVLILNIQLYALLKMLLVYHCQTFDYS